MLRIPFEIFNTEPELFRTVFEKFKARLELFRIVFQKFKMGLETFRIAFEKFKMGLELFRIAFEKFGTLSESVRIALEKFKMQFETVFIGVSNISTLAVGSAGDSHVRFIWPSIAGNSHLQENFHYIVSSVTARLFPDICSFTRGDINIDIPIPNREECL